MPLNGLLIIVFELYVFNASFLFLRGIKTHPIDFEKKFIDGKRIFGDGRTWEGSLLLLIFSLLFGHFLNNYYAVFTINILSYFGTLLNSFLKRRFDIKNWFPFDQIDFIIFPIIYLSLPIDLILIILGITIILHILSNKIAVMIGLKEDWETYLFLTEPYEKEDFK